MCFDSLKKDIYWGAQYLGEKDTGLYKKRNDHPHFYGMLLPIPSRLSVLADLEHVHYASYVEIENLLPDDFLRNNNLAQVKKVFFEALSCW